MWEEKENYSIGGKGSQDRRNEGWEEKENKQRCETTTQKISTLYTTLLILIISLPNLFLWKISSHVSIKNLHGKKKETNSDMGLSK